MHSSSEFILAACGPADNDDFRYILRYLRGVPKPYGVHRQEKGTLLPGLWFNTEAEARKELTRVKIFHDLTDKPTQS